MFEPSKHLRQIRNGQSTSDYLDVKWRLLWLREACPDAQIETKLVQLDLDRETTEEVSVWNAEKRRSEKVLKHGVGLAVFKATVHDGKGGVATGYGMEKAASSGNYLEKAETKSLGRALAALAMVLNSSAQTSMSSIE
jgi:hypothetical protein